MPIKAKTFGRLVRESKPFLRIPKPRLSRSKRGYTRQFYKFKRLWLSRHPTCVSCGTWGTRDNPVTVDHIIPLSQEGKNCDPSNSQTMCIRCNSRKARTEDAARLGAG